MEENNKSNKIELLFWAGLIATVLFRVVLSFSTSKDGFHSDEIWSYGLANSYYEPYVYMNADQTEYNYHNAWITGKTLQDYISVQDNQRFAYGSVVSNMKHDTHPPFYFLLLHTLCSLFPNQYSKWFGFSINIVSLVILLGYLYLLSKELFGNRFMAMISVLVFGLSVAGLSIFVYIRQYALLAAITTAFAYYSVKYLKADAQVQKGVVGIVISATLGLLTHYGFLVVLAAFFLWSVLELIRKKAYKTICIYVGGMAISSIPFALLTNGVSMILGMIIPQANMSVEAVDVASVVTSSSSRASMLESCRYSVNHILRDFLNYEITVDTFYSIKMVLLGIAFILVIAVPVALFLCRDKIKAGISYAMERYRSKTSKAVSDENHSGIINKHALAVLIICILGEILFASKFADMRHMGEYGDRYLFIIYPFVSICIVAIMHVVSTWIAKLIKGIRCKLEYNQLVKIVVAVFAVSYITSINVVQTSPYLFEGVNQEEYFHNQMSGKRVALFLSKEWLLTCYTNLLNEAGDIYVASSRTLDDIRDVKLDKKVDYVVFDASAIGARKFLFEKEDKASEEKDRRVIESETITPLMESVGVDELKFTKLIYIFGRVVYIYET